MRHLGPWVIEERLGAGAFGAVYSAHHAQYPGMRRAVKHLSATTESAWKRFQREAEILARLEHPGIVKVHEVGQDGPDRWFVMDLIPGESLRALLAKANEGLPVDDAVSIAAGIGHA